MTARGNLDLHPLNTDSLSLYVHVPFCRWKCDYCAFHSSVLLDPHTTEAHAAALPPDRYVEQTLRSLRARMTMLPDATVSTVYVGGGTPSCLGLGLLSRLLGGITTEISDRSALEEWTVEVNPEDLSPELLDCLRDAGVTRLSVGVQTFDPNLRRLLGRRGESHRLERALEGARRGWDGALSVDLITGIPGQTVEAAVRDADRLLHFEPDHVSAYALSVETGTPLALRYAGADRRPDFLSDGAATEAWEATGERLETAGFERYEVSNYARPGARCRHNERFWRGRPYLGVGPSAVSTLWATKMRHGCTRRAGDAAGGETGAMRWTESVGDGARELEWLGYRELLQEYLMTRLRTTEGLEMGTLRDIFGLDAARCAWSGSENLEREGLVVLQRATSHERSAAERRGVETRRGAETTRGVETRRGATTTRVDRSGSRACSTERTVTVTRRGMRYLDHVLRELFQHVGQLDSHLGKW